MIIFSPLIGRAKRPDTMKSRFIHLLKGSRTYWLLQLIGWSGMVLLETINYTFFLLGEFSFDYFQTFLIYAVIGILVTHLMRIVLKTYDIFSKSSYLVWTIAAVATVVCSFTSVFLIFIPSLITEPNEVLVTYGPIYILGLVLNNGRYFLIWMVIYFLYQIMAQRNQLAEERYLNFARAKNFELELLKKQINPHFLFNALNSIKALVLIDANKSRDAIVKLSELLRYTLNYEQQQLVTVEDELTEVKKYFELEKLRYGKRFEVRYALSENVMHEFIPSVLLLTLAENAIKHGVSKHVGKSVIDVIADGNEKGYFVSVANTGTLMKSNSRGIGLRYIERRIEEQFHNSGVFTLSENESRVTATIEIHQNENTRPANRRRTTGIRGTAGAVKRISGN